MANKNRISRGWPALLLPLFLAAAQAGPPALIRDLNTLLPPSDSSPYYLGALDNLSIYTTWINGAGRLVRSDGTSAGSFVIKTFDGSGPTTLNLESLMQAGQNAYFVAHESATGSELWVSDGTAAGTHLVADLADGSTGSFPTFLGEFSGKLVFEAMVTGGLRQVFITDGTSGGTTQLTSFVDASPQYISTQFAAVGGKFYFITFTIGGTSSPSLWVSNGTAGGTQIFTGLQAFSNNQSPGALRAVGNRLLLTGASGNSAALFSIDPATDTPTLLAVPDSGPVSPITVLNGYGYYVGRFSANSAEVWRSDGTLPGTTQVTNIQIAPGAGYLSFDGLHLAGNKIVIRANDGANGLQLWATDGTPGNQEVLTAIPGLTNLDLTSIPKTAAHLQVRANAGATPIILSTDGTAAGTRILPTAFEGQPLNFLNFTDDGTSQFLRYSSPGPDNTTNYSVFRYSPGAATELTLLRTSNLDNLGQRTFSARHGGLVFNSSDSTHGNELWISDAGGTRLLANLSAETSTGGSNPWWLTEWAGRAIYAADDGVHGEELWESDGTDAGTRLLLEMVPGASGSSFSHLMVLDGALYFFASDGTASRFMKLSSPGSTPQVLATLEAHTPSWNSPPPVLGRCGGANHALLGNKLYFPAASTSHGLELWVTDGTVAGTLEVADIHPAGDGTPCDLTVMNGRLYFGADGGAGNGGIELWSTDGTASGTRRVADMTPGDAGSSPQSLVAFNGNLYLVATLGTTEHLIRTDGSTVAYLEPVGASGPFTAFPLGSLNGKLLLYKSTAAQFGAPYEIWTSDGTSAGTIRIPEVLAHPWTAPLITASGTTLYFTNVAEAGSVDAWITDGTAGGTRQLTDLPEGRPSSPAGFLEFGSKVLITIDYLAGYNASETEFWRSNGTPEGTVLLGVAGWPAALGYSQGKGYLVLGQKLVFGGFETPTGFEMYVVSNEQPLAVNDTATASSGAATTISVLANDADPDGTLASGTVRIVQRPAHGSVDVGANGTIIYRPESGFSGTDTFAYVVTDLDGSESNVATVTMTVTSARKGGGGALQWWLVMVLALVAAFRMPMKPALQPRRWSR